MSTYTHTLAINIYDVLRIDAELRKCILSNRLDLSKVIDVRERVAEKDEYAIAFKCDLLEAALVGDILRSNDRKVGDPATRLYILKKSWNRIQGSVVLTEAFRKAEDGDIQVFLNSEIFGNSSSSFLIAPPADDDYGSMSLPKPRTAQQ